MARQLTFDDGAWFHVTNRGVAKQEIFRREPDYFAFLDCLGRHLGAEPARDLRGREYEMLGDRLTLSAFCLMRNHFHLLLRDESGAVQLVNPRLTDADAAVIADQLSDTISGLAQGTFLTATGELKHDERVKLGGVEVKLDAIQRFREQGLPIDEAIIRGGHQRGPYRGRPRCARPGDRPRGRASSNCR